MTAAAPAADALRPPGSALAAARRLARELLAPEAERVDRDGVPATHVAALADAGLLAVAGPPALGGASRDEQRAVAEELAAADASTWFVWTQHHTPLRLLLRAPERLQEEWLPRLTRDHLAGVAITHLRRRDGQLRATRVEGGWRLDGRISWLTSWGLADVVAVAADAGDEGYVSLLVDAVDQPGWEASPPMRLAAMGGTRTVSVRLDGVVVPAARELGLTAPVDWHAADDQGTADVTPAVFGVTRAALEGLEEPSLEAELDRLRREAYAAADARAPLADRQRIRGAAHALAVRATAAGMAAVGGRAMGLDHPAQRRAREALFLLVQAQVPEVRTATLRSLVG